MCLCHIIIADILLAVERYRLAEFFDLQINNVKMKIELYYLLHLLIEHVTEEVIECLHIGLTERAIGLVA